jgi:uncharacterized membrane protein
MVDEAAAAKQSATATYRREHAELEFSRIVAFTDGVFAIAITLLVLALEIPVGTEDLGQALRDRGNELFAYALSFAVLAKLWLAHHRFYGWVARFDGRLIALNLFYLAWVALVPFTSELLGNFSDDSVAVIAYAVDMTAISVIFGAQIAYAYRHDLMRAEAKPLERRFAGRANFIVPVVFAASIPVSLLSATAAQLMWLAIFAVGRRVGDMVAGRPDPTA